MTTTPDGFDAGAEAVWEAKKRGETILKADLARIVRTAYQAFQIDHPPPKEAQPPKGKIKHPLAAALPKAQRDALFEALVQFEGVTDAQITANGRFKITDAREQILAVCPDISPGQIIAAGNRYKKLYPNVTPTSMGLATNWHLCGGGQKTEVAKKDPYQEPANWRLTAKRLHPDAANWVNPHDFDTMSWLEVSIHIRKEILRCLPT